MAGKSTKKTVEKSVSDRKNGKAPKKNPKKPRKTGRTVEGRSPEAWDRHKKKASHYTPVSA